MYVQFCNQAKSCAYWLVNETLWYETETFDFQSETRLRPSYVSTRLETFGNYVSRSSRGRDIETTSLPFGTIILPNVSGVLHSSITRQHNATYSKKKLTISESGNFSWCCRGMSPLRAFCFNVRIRSIKLLQKLSNIR